MAVREILVCPVTGTCGHSRMPELVFGGVAETLLAEGDLACLTVH